MSGTDAIITLAWFLKAEFPAGDVRLCDGGFLDYASERYDAQHAVFGSLAGTSEAEASFGDMAESAELMFAPNPDADPADWWRDDLFDCRVRFWQGELDADLVTVSNAELIGDFLVDNIIREQGPGGSDLLRLPLIGRPEKLFLKQEGNVCSERHHKSVWAGELGFNNCTDLQGFIAWGSAAPSRGEGVSWRQAAG